MSTRERTTEYATMRAIGFEPRHIELLVLGEGFVVAALGVLLGVALATPILSWLSEIFAKYVPGFLGEFHLDGNAVLLAVGIGLSAGMAAAELPAWRARRLKIVDALRRLA
jgi:putative ABC transport system permease protein